MSAFTFMVTGPFVVYFTAAATSAAALIGLLFVAVSLRDDSIFGPHAIAGSRALASSSFTALVNAFFVSVLALVPGADVGYPAAILAALAVAAHTRLQRALPRDPGRSTTIVITYVAYAGQFAEGAALIVFPHLTGLVAAVAYQVFASMAVALQRAWALISNGGLDRQEPSADSASNP
jgi:hypothetical protein